MSSLKDLASLIMVPSLVKDGRLDTVKPLGNSILHPDATGNNDGTDGSTPAEGNFTFSRGSNLAATRVASSGYIEKGRENLLLQSNSFSTSPFVTSNVSLTSGQSGYDGTNDAWELSTTGVNGFENLYQNISFTGVHTISIYAKAGSNAYLTIRSLTSDFRVQFKLDDGTHSTTFGSPINTFMEDAGAGWYRCGFTANFSSASSWVFYPQRIGITDAGYVYIQDAQLESSLVATDYIETGATTAQAGILEDLPRLDYSGGASCPALLLEPSRTNGFSHSEYFDGFSLDVVSISYNATSPENLTNAATLTGTGNFPKVRAYPPLSDNTKYCISVFVKSGTASVFGILAKAKDNSVYHIECDLSDGSTTNVGTNTPSDSGSVNYGNGWYRFYMVYDSLTGATGSPELRLLNHRSTSDNGWTDGLTILAYGGMHELGSYPTSYIPTYGSAVTRSVDDMTTTFSSPLATNGSATIFYHELGLPDSDDINTSAGRYRYQKDSNNYVSLTTNATAWRVRIQSGGTSNFEGLNDHLKTDSVKIAVVVSSTHFSIFANGVKEIDNQALAATADFSSIDDFVTFIQDEVGARKTLQHAVFPTALTDSECIALTTL